MGLGRIARRVRGAVPPAVVRKCFLCTLDDERKNAGLARGVPVIVGVCSVPRCDIDVIMTEPGASDLRTCSAVKRGERVIRVAAPQHHAGLVEAFRDIATKFLHRVRR